LPRAAGHRSGTQTARSTIETCARLKIEALSLYAFSVENWRRPKTETDFLMQLLREYLRQEMPLIQRNNIRMRFLGRARELPAGVQQDMRDAEDKTAKNTGMVLCLALNYGGRAERYRSRAHRERESHAGERRRSIRASLYRGVARSGPADSLQRGDAHQQFSALADCLRGDFCHRNAVAGF